MGRVAHDGSRQPARRCLPPQHTECPQRTLLQPCLTPTYAVPRTLGLFTSLLFTNTQPPPPPIHIHVQVCLPPSCYTILSRSSMNHTPIQWPSVSKRTVLWVVICLCFVYDCELCNQLNVRVYYYCIAKRMCSVFICVDNTPNRILY